MQSKALFLLVILLTSISVIKAQNNVGINTNTPNASAALDIVSTDKGVLIPRVNLMDINGMAPLSSVTEGMLVYNTNSNVQFGTGKGFYYWDGIKWVKMLNSTLPLNYWSKSGNSIGAGSSAYIGTNDDQDLVFQRNGLLAGRISTTNTSFGRFSHWGTSNSHNSSFGTWALYNINTGNSNCAFGYASLSTTSTGDSNVAVGYSALASNHAGHFNVGIGSLANYNNQDGDYNTAVGYNTGVQNFTGGSENYNTTLGANANVSPFISKATAIGAYAKATDSNTLILGGTGAFKVKVGIGTSSPDIDVDILQSIGTSRGIRLRHATNFSNYWTTYVDDAADYNFGFNGFLKSYINDANGNYVVNSDRRLKKDINDVQKVLFNVLKLQPKTYHYNDNKITDPLSYGFIAQEVEEIFPEFVTTKEDTGMKAIAYDNFGVIAIQAIKEQQVIINQQRNDIDRLEKEMQALKNLITNLK